MSSFFTNAQLIFFNRTKLTIDCDHVRFFFLYELKALSYFKRKKTQKNCKEYKQEVSSLNRGDALPTISISVLQKVT